ncbi:MAG TPA: T9SS type A sorting domain-containing protein [Paludibacteraceae bacterium]|nr:T9SS type A sorting domain-containing protein [Paludibacteraceae bacterium]
MKIKYFFGFLWTMVIIHISVSIQAQNPTYLCELRNDAQVSCNIFEFDIYLIRTGTIPFEYATGQYGILVNPLFKNGGVITASIVAGSSDPALILTNQNPTNISFLNASNCIRIAGRIPPGSGNGAIISNGSPGTKICRVRLTNTVAFGQFTPNLTWTTQAIYPTQINAYVGGSNTTIMLTASQTTNNLNNVEPAGIWSGVVNSDWGNPGNWLCGAVPTSSTDVIITSAAQSPIVNSAGTARCHSITIHSGASLSVNSGSDLSVYGNWTNNGQSNIGDGTVIFLGGLTQSINGVTTFGNLTISNLNGVTINNNTQLTGILTPSSGVLASNGHLTLLSTASRTALIAGTGSGSVTGNVTMERYMENRLGYHYYSSPFTGAPINEFTDELGTLITGNPYVGNDTTHTVTPFPNFFMYDEPLGPSMSIGWTGAGTTMTPMRGYCINFGASTAPLTADVTGVVNSGALNFSVTKSTTGNNYADGWNLVGNPYPSPIDWQASSGWTKINVSDGIYYFNPNTQYTGTYSSFVNGIGIPSGTTGIIPSMQGFFVKATANGILGVNDAVRTTDLTPSFNKTLENPDALLRLKGYPAMNELHADETVVYFDPLATFIFDGNMDAYKLLNNDPAYPNIFTKDSSNYSLSISALPSLSNTDVVIPLGFTTKTSGSFTIKATEILNFDPSFHIYLEDNQNSTSQDLTVSPEYTFTINANAPLFRFFIRFSPTIVTGIEENSNSFVDAWSSGKYINVNYSNSTQGNAFIFIYNMLGQKIINDEQTGIGTTHYRIETPGCYIINVLSGSKNYQKTLIIK